MRLFPGNYISQLPVTDGYNKVKHIDESMYSYPIVDPDKTIEAKRTRSMLLTLSQRRMKHTNLLVQPVLAKLLMSMTISRNVIVFF